MVQSIWGGIEMSNNENTYLLKLEGCNAFFVSPEIESILKKRFEFSELEGMLSSYGVKTIVSQEAIDYLNKIWGDENELSELD